MVDNPDINKIVVKRTGKYAEPVPKEEQLDNKTSPSKAALTSGRSIELVKLDPITIERYLNAHPVMPVGIDKKANRIINRGYVVTGGKEDIQAYCDSILQNSGGLIAIKQWIKDGYGFGDSFMELVQNKAGNKIILIQVKHPVYFGYYKVKQKGMGVYGSESYVIAFDTKTNKPRGYCEYIIGDDKKRVPVKEAERNIIPLNRCAHLKFQWWGDEIEGTSVMQPVNQTVKQIMNIEDAGAETMYRNGFVQKKFTTNLTTKKKLEDFAESVKNATEQDAIILSKDTDCVNLNPGQTDFVQYHEQFLQLLSIALEMPKPLVTQSGTSTNKATLDSQREDMYEDTYADELLIKKTIDEQIFKPAIELAFPNAKVEDYPEFRFKPRPSEVDIELKRKESLSNTMLKLARAAKLFKEADMMDKAKNVLDRIQEMGEEDDIWTIRGEFEDGPNTSKSVGVLSGKRKANKRVRK